MKRRSRLSCIGMGPWLREFAGVSCGSYTMRLPASWRVPLILCYLQGQTQDEAARQLGWSKSTFRGRLERGRALLQTRLVRRGLTLSAGLVGALVSEPAPAPAPALPAAFFARTVKAALRQAMNGKPTLELRQRLEQLLQRLEGPAVLRRSRALEVLENIGDAEAHRLLHTLAQGAPQAELTQQAQAALKRLRS